ncbi:hypothetical protein KKG41_01770 [Patescibacteria group bacterium]|nr:hypothetical protein [Patescibacteria group bacterium]MBU1890380.1 hypothetical protein [Patescibacteria group bacterium]
MTEDNKKGYGARTFWGIVIILIGVVFLLHKMDVIVDIGFFGYLFLIVPGIGLWFLFFSRRGRRGIEGLLIPGTILTLLGAFFMYQEINDWEYSGETSFIYIIIVALSFFSAHIFGNRSRGFLVPAWILTIVSLIILFTTTIKWDFIWPAVVIVLGLWLLVKPKRKNQNIVEEQPENKEDDQGA